MKQVTTYVGIDAHKKDLFIAMLVGDRTAPVTWQVANGSASAGAETRAGGAGPRARVSRSRAVRLRVAATNGRRPAWRVRSSRRR